MHWLSRRREHVKNRRYGVILNQKKQLKPRIDTKEHEAEGFEQKTGFTYKVTTQNLIFIRVY